MAGTMIIKRLPFFGIRKPLDTLKTVFEQQGWTIDKYTTSTSKGVTYTNELYVHTTSITGDPLYISFSYDADTMLFTFYPNLGFDSTKPVDQQPGRFSGSRVYPLLQYKLDGSQSGTYYPYFFIYFNNYGVFIQYVLQGLPLQRLASDNAGNTVGGSYTYIPYYDHTQFTIGYIVIKKTFNFSGGQVVIFTRDKTLHNEAYGDFGLNYNGQWVTQAHLYSPITYVSDNAYNILVNYAQYQNNVTATYFDVNNTRTYNEISIYGSFDQSTYSKDIIFLGSLDRIVLVDETESDDKIFYRQFYGNRNKTTVVHAFHVISDSSFLHKRYIGVIEDLQ